MKMRFDRLEKLITVLQDAEPENFSMEVFAKPCGTPACVLGHYAARRDLQRIFRLTGTALSSATATNVGQMDIEIQEHFGLGSGCCSELFGPDGCGGAKTPKQAISYIRKFIDRHKAAS